MPSHQFPDSPSLRVSELRADVLQEVQRLTRGQQRPKVRSDNIEYDFPVD